MSGMCGVRGVNPAGQKASSASAVVLPGPIRLAIPANIFTLDPRLMTCDLLEWFVTNHRSAPTLVSGTAWHQLRQTIFANMYIDWPSTASIMTCGQFGSMSAQEARKAIEVWLNNRFNHDASSVFSRESIARFIELQYIDSRDQCARLQARAEIARQLIVNRCTAPVAVVASPLPIRDPGGYYGGLAEAEKPAGQASPPTQNRSLSGAGYAAIAFGGLLLFAWLNRPLSPAEARKR